MSVTNGSVTGTQVTTPATIKTGDTEVEYSITLSTPGDFYEFTVDAVNEGSIDAMIESFSNKTYESNGTTEKTLPTYLNYSVTYSDGVSLAPKQKLDANTTEKIKVRVEFKRDIEASELPTTADTIVFKFNVTYVQEDDSSEEVNHPINGTFYTINNYRSANEEERYVRINQPFPKRIKRYTSFNEITNAWTILAGKPQTYYLKHIVENNIVKESYLEFVVTPEMASDNTNIYNGTYTLIKGEDESELEDKPVYIENAKTLYNAFGNECTSDPYTTEIESYYECSISGMYVALYSSGTITIGDKFNIICSLYSDGSSACGY